MNEWMKIKVPCVKRECTNKSNVLQMSQLWSLKDSVLRGAALGEIRALGIIYSHHVWGAMRVIVRVKLWPVSKTRVSAWCWVFGEVLRRCLVRHRLLRGFGRRRGQRWVLGPQMDVAQAGQSGAVRRWGRRGRAGGGSEALHALILLLLHAPVLEPHLDLALVQVQQVGHLHAPWPAQVPAEVELLLQLHELRARVGSARAFGRRGRACALVGTICGETQTRAGSGSISPFVCKTKAFSRKINRKYLFVICIIHPPCLKIHNYLQQNNLWVSLVSYEQTWILHFTSVDAFNKETVKDISFWGLIIIMRCLSV